MTRPSHTQVGGYQLVYIDNYNEVFCSCCANGLDDSLTPHVHWEGTPLHCCDCDKVLESEYGYTDDDEGDIEYLTRLAVDGDLYPE